MRIVIDIPEDEYQNILHTGKTSFRTVNAIEAGTLLPKGHGRLIDADALNLEKEVSMADDWKTAHEIANCVKYAPTIIEADKEENK